MVRNIDARERGRGDLSGLAQPLYIQEVTSSMFSVSLNRGASIVGA